MSKTLIGLAVLAIGALSSRYYYVRQSDFSALPLPRPASLLAEPARMTLSLTLHGVPVLRGYEQFSFGRDSQELNLSPNNDGFLRAVARYLHQHPGYHLTIVGGYLKNEQPTNSNLKDLGIARASAVREVMYGAYGLPEAAIQVQSQQLPDNAPETAHRVMGPRTPLAFLLTERPAAEVPEPQY